MQPINTVQTAGMYIFWPFLEYRILTVSSFIVYTLDLFTIGRTPWASNQPVARSLPDSTNTEKRTHTHTHTKHPYPKWDSNPRSQRPSEGRQLLDRVATVTGFIKLTAQNKSGTLAFHSYLDTCSLVACNTIKTQQNSVYEINDFKLIFFCITRTES
jgi:hypothetical protein